MSCLAFFGDGNSIISWIFSGSGLIPSVVRIKPRNLVSFLKKLDLLKLSVRLFLSRRANNSSRCSKCCVVDSDVMRVSSTNQMM